MQFLILLLSSNHLKITSDGFLFSITTWGYIMTKGTGVSDQLTILHHFSVSVLIAYIHDFLRTHQGTTLDLADIHMLTQIVNDQVLRNIVNPRPERKRYFVD